VRHKVWHAVTCSQNIVRKEATRLSWGQRLTNSADDSAGKAVETQFFARLRSRKVAQRNTAYASDLCRVAQGGLDEIQESVLRLHTLAVQATTDSITDKERAYLQTEANGLLENIDNVALSARVHEDHPLLNQVPVDIGFVIDTSNSMGGFMNTLKTHIDTFADNVTAKGFNVAFGLSKARPIT
jgi:flagellin-like hook-associated protein FlgL